jgi:Flp pilus assembly protein TadD
MQSRRPHHLQGALALCLATACGLAGCQTFGGSSWPGAAARARAEPAATLAASQVADIRIAQGQMLAKEGDLASAQDTLLQAVKKDPSRADAWAELAVLADRQGKFSESEEYYSKARKLGGETAALCCNRGYSYYLQRRWAEAEASLRRAIALEPATRRAHNNLGLVLAHTGRTGDALVEFRRAGCTEAETETNLAFSLALEGSWPEAQSHYQQALSADPALVPAQQGLRSMEAVLAKARPAPAADQHAAAVSPAGRPPDFGNIPESSGQHPAEQAGLCEWEAAKSR